MNTVIQLVLLALAVVCVGIPVVAVAVVHRDELAGLKDGVRKALAFDPRHAPTERSRRS